MVLINALKRSICTLQRHLYKNNRVAFSVYAHRQHTKKKKKNKLPYMFSNFVQRDKIQVIRIIVKGASPIV